MTVTTSVPPYLPQKATYEPTHPHLFKISFAEGSFNSSLKTERSFSAQEIICAISNTLPGTKAYSSVQVFPDPPIPTFIQNDPTAPRHIELNSDLLYVNHSCDPNVAFEVPSSTGGKGMGWCVRALRELKKGEIMTFAYFSTEWFMDQPFQCLCGSTKCLGVITGAQNIDKKVLDTYYINEHIVALKEYQEAEGSSKKSV